MMPRFKSLLACVLIASVLATCSRTIGADPLLYDSFESGEAAPNGWRQGAAVAGVRYRYDKGNASAGKRSLSLQKTAKRYFPIAEWARRFDHRKGVGKLDVSAKVKASQVTKAIIELRFYDGNSRPMGKQWVSYIGQKESSDRPATHGWKNYTDTVNIPEGTDQLVLALQIYGPGKVWFDEVRVAEQGAEAAAPTSIRDSSPSPPRAPAAVSSPKPRSLKLTNGGWSRFVFMPPRDSANPPTDGHPLLFILPGGDGSMDFHPFVRSIHEKALQQRFAVIQLVAPPQVVWPTAGSRSRFASTEESINGITEHLEKKYSVDRSRVFALGWSSSGPAIYASLLRPDSRLTGAMIAMSVFHENNHPSIASVTGKRIHLLHSPQDKVCPYRMSERAETVLRSAGAEVELVQYDGGHGWHGDIFGNIRSGMDWLLNEN